MSPISDVSNPREADETRSDEVHVTLPCTPDHFAEFITGLLGKPQTISRRFRMLFSVDRADLESLHHLIVQRVSQQNDATLVQFVAVITFNDSSSVRITSFDDFQRYNEVRPLRSVAVLLNWVFLINFRDRRHPEKQEISIRFMMPEYDDPERYEYEGIFGPVRIHHHHFGSLSTSGTIEVIINYTARTWGNDVDNLVKGHIQNMEKHDNYVVGFIIRHSGAIRFWTSVCLILLGIVGLTIYADRVDQVRTEQIDEMLDTDRDMDTITMDALRALLKNRLLLSDGISGTQLYLLGGLACVIVSIILGIATASVADAMARSSHILLRKKSEIHAQERHVEHRRKMVGFLSVQCLNIIIGIALIALGHSISEYWAL